MDESKTDESKLLERNGFLLRRLREEQSKNASLLQENAWLNEASDHFRQRYADTYGELRELREDTERALQFNGTVHVQHEMERWRENYRRLSGKRARWMELARRAVERKVRATVVTTDHAIALQQLKERLRRAEEGRQATADMAQKIIGVKQAQLDRIEEQCRLWRRGQIATKDAMSGITAEMGGHPLPDLSQLERAKEIRAKEEQSALHLLKNDVDEWKTLEARARGVILQLLDLFGHGGNGVAARMHAGEYAEALTMLKSKLNDEREERM